MELEQILEYVSDIDALRGKMSTEKVDDSKIETYKKQYNPSGHDIADTGKRPDKIVKTDTATKSVKVARLSIPMQKKIVGLSAAFLCANPIQISATAADDIQSDLLSMIQKAWDDGKLNYKTSTLCKLMMSETEVAELWYLEEADETYWSNTPNEGSKFKLRMRILGNSLGDTLYPSFNAAGDLVAFARSYEVKTDAGVEKHFDLYTDDKTYLAVNKSSSWAIEEKVNVFKKIPVIYYRQDQPEWQDVQSLIDRWELSISKHADTNDYFGSPMVKVTGEVKGFSDKGEDGKVLELKGGADASYLTWNQSPESVKLEQENLRSLIYDMTDTPDISFQQMKGLGTYSGFAIKMLFTSAHLKAADKESIFGEGIQRRLNFIKAAMINVINVKMEKANTLNIKPVFTYFLPADIKEEIENLVSAVSGGILSVPTAVKKNPLVDDAEEEVKLIESAESEPSGLDNLNNDEEV